MSDKPEKDAHKRNAVPTDNPHIARTVTLFRAVDDETGEVREFGWIDEGNITVFGAKTKLAAYGIDTSTWQYDVDGNTYDLPIPLAFYWKQETGKESGRPYKQITAIDTDPPPDPARAAEVLDTLRRGMNGDDTPDAGEPEPVRIDVKGERKFLDEEGVVFLPATKFEDELARIAVDLKQHDIELEEARSERQRFEKAALDALKIDRPDLYKRETQALAAHDALKGYAQELVTLYGQASGNTGRFLGGWYQINAPEKLQLRSETDIPDFVHYLMEWMPHLMVDVPGLVTINLPALHKKLGGKIPDMVAGLRGWVKYAPVPKPQINWKALPVPDTSPADSTGDTEELEPVNGDRADDNGFRHNTGTASTNG